MKRERPPMPSLAVRVKVAERQWHSPPRRIDIDPDYLRVVLTSNLTERLAYLLNGLFGDQPRALDHDPALILRKYNPRIKDVASRYTPHAHDPDALIYREKADHLRKTTGRKPGASKTATTKGSDVHLAAKFRRLENPRPKRKRATIATRGFPKGSRKIQSRGFR